MSKGRQAGMVDLEAETMAEVFVVWICGGGLVLPEVRGTFLDPRRADEKAQDLTQENDDSYTFKVARYRVVVGDGH